MFPSASTVARRQRVVGHGEQPQQQQPSASVQQIRKRFEPTSPREWPKTAGSSAQLKQQEKTIAGGNKPGANETRRPTAPTTLRRSKSAKVTATMAMSSQQVALATPTTAMAFQQKPPKPKVPPKPSKLVTTKKTDISVEPKNEAKCGNDEEHIGQKENLAIQRPFSRANSIRRPKCKPPPPTVDMSETVPNDGKPEASASPAIRKPSARPPPPPIAQNGAANVPMLPKLPSQPPPPLPPNCLESAESQNIQFPVNPSTSVGSIYEEIEEKPIDQQQHGQSAESQAGSYTPKFRKKEGPPGREWPKRRERRRTTQLDLLWTHRERFSMAIPGCSWHHPPSPPCAPPPASLCRSLHMHIKPSSRAAEFSRIGAGLRQNLAKGMGKLRSRVSSLASSTPTPSASAARTFLQQNFRTLTLGRAKSERMAAETLATRGRTQSTFYLDGTQHDDEGNEGCSLAEEELFGDDWSSTDDEVDAFVEQHQQQGSIDSTEDSPAYQYCTHPAEEESQEAAAATQSLLAEIESEYQRLQLSKRQRQPMDEETAKSSSKNDVADEQQSENSGAILLPERPTLANAEKPPEAPSNNADSEPPSPIPSPSYASQLPEQQPLYQIYLLQEQQRLTAEVLEPISEAVVIAEATINVVKSDAKEGGDRATDEQDSACPDTSGESEEGGGSAGSAVATIVRRHSSSTTDSGRADSLPLRPLRRERLLGQSMYGSQRSLWCELPEVKESGLLERMDEEQKKLQEAYFEVITSEASYLRSISFLISHFMSAPELLAGHDTRSVITTAERKQLFSNIIAIRDCSERLLSELEVRLKEGLVLTDICDILCAHFEAHFEPYVKYCSNQVYQDRTLKKLKDENTLFVGCIQRLEQSRQCQGLDMRSFLMLPMQRVTRYPLLIDAILVWLHPDDQRQHSLATRALTLANQVVHNCNEGARRMERTEQLLDIESRLVYKCADLKRVPLVSSGRYVLKSGQLMQLADRGTKPKLGSARGQARPLALFLFNDMLLIAKRRLNGQFVCKDYALRRFVVLEPLELSSLRVPPSVQAALGTRSPHLISCVLFQNARGRQVELFLNAESESDRERWLSAMRPPTCANPDEKIYAEWDCPQALAVHNYEASQEDELSLSPGDMINILRKVSDGWCYGERLRDGKGGWFPSSYVQQVLNDDHVRAQNYRQRLRVLQSVSEYRTMQKMQNKRSSLATPLSSSIASTSTQSSPQHEIHILSRFRRLSNPRAYFSS